MKHWFHNRRQRAKKIEEYKTALVIELCHQADGHLGGKATLRTLNYFTGVPVDDFIEELEKKQLGKVKEEHWKGPPVYFFKFLVDCCVVGASEEVRARDLYKAFENWRKENYPEDRVPSQKVFGGMLARRFSRKKSSGRVVYLGLNLKGKGHEDQI